MVFDTNLVIKYLRRRENLPAEAIISVVVAGELEAFALKNGWGYERLLFMRAAFEQLGLVEIDSDFIPIYALLDAYSQGRHPLHRLPPGLSARNMGKNDLWIAATALYFDVELHTTDKDFDHLAPLGLKVVRG